MEMSGTNPFVVLGDAELKVNAPAGACGRRFDADDSALRAAVDRECLVLVLVLLLNLPHRLQPRRRRAGSTNRFQRTGRYTQLKP